MWFLIQTFALHVMIDAHPVSDMFTDVDYIAQRRIRLFTCVLAKKERQTSLSELTTKIDRTDKNNYILLLSSFIRSMTVSIKLHEKQRDGFP